MNPLEKIIIDRIKLKGPMTFETFMDIALYEPQLGYYASPDISIGRSGDFYTSQHVHPAFGIMIARQLEEMWEIMGKPSEYYAIELGAGSGLMCLDILQYLRKRDLFHSLNYLIVETNPSVQLKQRNILSDYLDRVRWISDLEKVAIAKGCILSNELLDSFPVHLIEMDEEPREVYVDIDSNSPNSGSLLREVKGKLSTDDIRDYLREFSIRLPEGYRTEINLRIKKWLGSVAGALSEGFILTIDYGYPAHEYYSEERNRGTLLCYFKHQSHENFYANIGQQDITAHVNFSSVKKWGEQFGFRTLGFCRQGTYLISLGIDRLIQELLNSSADYLFEVAAIKKLIFPGTIGDTHKVMVQYKGNGNPELKGFSMKNKANTL